MDFIDYELSRKIDEIERKEREERIKNGQICRTCEHWKLRIDKRVPNWELPCAENWGIIDPNDTCHCWKENDELVNFMIEREKEIVRKEEEVYKAIAKSKATKHDIAEFIETMDYTPTPLQYVFIMDAITKMGMEMYDKGIVPSKMSNDAFDIAYEEMLQKTFSRIREHLEDDGIKGDYLIQ